MAANLPDGLVSTGNLPSSPDVQRLVEEAFERFRGVDAGANASVYPSLEHADPDRFGICVATVGGAVHGAGDHEVAFPLMSVAKPFTFALVCEAIGAQAARDQIGVNATGLPFNAVEPVERQPGGRTNPMVNPGAIATVSLVPGRDAADRWGVVHDGLSRFAGRRLPLDEELYACAIATNQRNRAIVQLLDAVGVLADDPVGTLDVYNRQSCLAVTARDLAVMGATLADGGVNPLTGEQVVRPDTCRHTLAVMATAGLYETSGEWLYDVGLPGKSGIGGGIVTVSPGKGGLGTFSPPLDRAGNSVRGQLVARELSRRLGLDLFASQPAR
ncbi:MAG: glutaminase A [Acidimicrobiales bacterium]|jgi:glutaminase|nr:glutaminase A [Acidimicrobiales bacterium]